MLKVIMLNVIMLNVIMLSVMMIHCQQAEALHVEVVQDALLRVPRPHPDRLQERRGGAEVWRIRLSGELHSGKRKRSILVVNEIK
jgi:hypothetical protein